jgi:polar amino acid transport system substrate-binding protein
MGKSDLIKVAGVTDVVIDVFASFSPKKEKSKEYAKILSEETIKMREDGRLKVLLDKYGIKDWQSK